MDMQTFSEWWAEEGRQIAAKHGTEEAAHMAWDAALVVAAAIVADQEDEIAGLLAAVDSLDADRRSLLGH